jgi:hypothetical protein
LLGALVADFVDLYTPHQVCSTQAISRPPIDPVKALRTNVARQYPQNRIPKSEIEKASTSCRHKCNANTAAPLIGINVECTQLSMARHIRFAGWRWARRPWRARPVAARRRDRHVARQFNSTVWPPFVYDLSNSEQRDSSKKCQSPAAMPPKGYSICLVFLKLFERIYTPLTTGLLHPFSAD